MTFSLTEQLTDEIISAMENQETEFVVDAAGGDLVQVSDCVKADDTNYYKLPEWNPADGFALRDDFVKDLHAPLAHDELQSVLHSGRGVFRNFRNVLKKYPEIDKRWHIFKHRTMSTRINEWYNSLREIWGLESLDQLSESDESLVYDDFSFTDYDSDTDNKEILFNINAFIQDDEQNLPKEIKKALYEMWSKQFSSIDSANQVGFICRSLSDEFAGCITGCPATENQDETFVLTSLYVPEQFRGLGIGTELISMFVTKIQSIKTKWILMPLNMIPEFLEPLLVRTGFEKYRYGYVAKI